MREEGELPLRSLLKSRANPASLLMSVKTLSPYLQRTIPVLPVFDLLSVTLKLTLDGGKLAVFLFLTVSLWEDTAGRLNTESRQREKRSNALIRIHRLVFDGVGCVLEGSEII